jgi:lipopolysaccharide transport system ATP-binding protein
MSTVISVEHVSKSYRLGMIGGASLNEDLARVWARMRGKPDPMLKVDEQHKARLVGQHFSALSDVSFGVKDGEVLGVIGRNGAGKSTLLKILAQVTGPTSGRIRIKGRVASLLEVGTGFHPDLTGRENVFLNGAIMGMTKAEIRRKFDEIVEFSECGEFIDTPVKRYSSGMYVRLAFAVAGHLEPEILIVDEVLAVGDAQFQKKCLGKMSEVSRGGRTVLFVSHNMVAVQTLCHRALLLQDGRLATEGPTASVVSAYLRDAYGREETASWSKPEDAPGTDALRVKQIQVTGLKASADGLIGMDSPIRIDTDFWVLKPGLQLHITYHLSSDEGTVVLTTGCQPARRQPGLYRASFTLPGNLLNSGGYSLKFLLVQNESHLVLTHDAIASFSVVDIAERQAAYMGREPGAVQIPLPWVEASLEGSQVALTS